MSELKDKITEYLKTVKEIENEIKKVIVSQDKLIKAILISIFSKSHLLIEGPPGLAKTLAVKTIAKIINLDFKRIQFTPDLLPSDLTGSMIYQDKGFKIRKGPIFSQLLLADEINRAPAKVQSALLEAMEEKQVTIGDDTYELDDLFFVFATLNPIEQEGTYSLPEAQLDRFMLKVILDYPSKKEEIEILNNIELINTLKVNDLLDLKTLKDMQNIIKDIFIDKNIIKYIVDIVTATRQKDTKYNKFIDYGASPRASIGLYKSAKTIAFLEGRDFVIPEDIKYVAPAILRHRIILSYEAEIENISQDNIISMILTSIHVP